MIYAFESNIKSFVLKGRKKQEIRTWNFSDFMDDEDLSDDEKNRLNEILNNMKMDINTLCNKLKKIKQDRMDIAHPTEYKGKEVNKQIMQDIINKYYARIDDDRNVVTNILNLHVKHMPKNSLLLEHS